MHADVVAAALCRRFCTPTERRDYNATLPISGGKCYKLRFGLPLPRRTKPVPAWPPGQTPSGTSHEAVYTSCHSGDGPGRIEYLPSHITVNDPRDTAIFGRPPHKPELYDRTTDPDQFYDIAEANEDIVDTLRIGLVKFMRQQGAGEEYVRQYAMGAGG